MRRRKSEGGIVKGKWRGLREGGREGGRDGVVNGGEIVGRGGDGEVAGSPSPPPIITLL